MIDMNKFFDRDVEFKDGKYWMDVQEAVQGDYSGGAVEAANLRWLEKNYPEDIRVVNMAFRTPVPWANMSNKDLMDAIEGLWDYPCFDDEMVSNLEMETILEYVVDLVERELEEDIPPEVIKEAVYTEVYGTRLWETIQVEMGLLVYVPDEEALVEAVIKRLK